MLKLTFDENVGPAPRNAYWLWIAREGQRVIQWQYLVGGAAEAPTTAAWTDWQKFDGILLSLLKTDRREGRRHPLRKRHRRGRTRRLPLPPSRGPLISARRFTVLVLAAASRRRGAARGPVDRDLPGVGVLPDPVRALVLTPPSYDREPARRYPVLYFLHDAWGDEGSLRSHGVAAELRRRMADGRLPEFLVVAPGARGSWFSDSYDGKRLWGRFLTVDLVRAGRGALPRDPGSRGAGDHRHLDGRLRRRQARAPKSGALRVGLGALRRAHSPEPGGSEALQLHGALDAEARLRRRAGPQRARGKRRLADPPRIPVRVVALPAVPARRVRRHLRPRARRRAVCLFGLRARPRRERRAGAGRARLGLLAPRDDPDLRVARGPFLV